MLKILDNPVYKFYSIFSGTNTGYGFYGINVSTHKFFVVKLYDSNNELLKEVHTFDFKMNGNLSRFEVLASKMANYVVDNREHPDKKSKEFAIKSLYVEKIFKHLGLYLAKKEPKCAYYKVDLKSIITSDIRGDENYNETKKVSTYESIRFKTKRKQLL